MKKKIQELSTENGELKEINIKLQLENYNLQKKIRQFESSQLSQPQKSIREGESIEDNFDQEFEHEQSKEYYEVIETTGEEYLDEDFSSQDEPPNKKEKIDYEIEISEHSKEESDIECNQEGIKEAFEEICRLAATRGVLNKIKDMPTGKHKDSAFVSKILELVFDKYTLASSSAQGQKCQRDLNSAPKPALDATKLELCRRAFTFRLKSDESSPQVLKARLKVFYKLVNDKIQNVRKCLNRNEAIRDEC